MPQAGFEIDLSLFIRCTQSMRASCWSPRC